MTQRTAVKADGKGPKAQTRSPNRKLRKTVSVTCVPSVSSSRKKKQKQMTATKQAPKRRAKKDEEIIIKAKKRKPTIWPRIVRVRPCEVFGERMPLPRKSRTSGYTANPNMICFTAKHGGGHAANAATHAQTSLLRNCENIWLHPCIHSQYAAGSY